MTPSSLSGCRNWLPESGKAVSDALADYQSMTTAVRRQVLLAEYRCRTKGCLLLHVWQTPQGRFWYTPRYKLSPQLTESDTTESARDKRTDDGGRWLPRADSLDRLLAFFANESETETGELVVTSYSNEGGLPLNCEHVRSTVDVAALAEAATAAPGQPVKAFI